MSFSFGCTGCDYSGGVANTQRLSILLKDMLNEQCSTCKSIFYCKSPKAEIIFSLKKQQSIYFLAANWFCYSSFRSSNWTSIIRSPNHWHVMYSRREPKLALLPKLWRQTCNFAWSINLFAWFIVFICVIYLWEKLKPAVLLQTTLAQFMVYATLLLK